MFSIQELIDVIIMTLGVGFIFKDSFQIHDVPKDYDPLTAYEKRGTEFWKACLITAPGVIFHELAHKLVALGFGLSATFHAAYGWLAIGILLKLMNFGLIFFVPGYVSIIGIATLWQDILIAFAGPFLNLFLFGFASLALKFHVFSRRHDLTLGLMKQINLFLFVFNILPIPGFDGFRVWAGLFELMF